jgi:NitT/TauT family transport system substrate-binding protein
MFNARFLSLMALLIATTLVACAPTATSTRVLTPVTVQLRWTHTAQFAGFYAADQNGYYATEGLTVSWREGGPNVDFVGPAEDGRAQFSIANADALILNRADGKPLRAIATIFRRNPTAVMSLAASAINRPKDLVGKRIEVGRPGFPFAKTMLARGGINPDQYTLVESSPDLAALYTGKVDARFVFVTDQVLTAQAAGYKVNLIYPDDYGVHFYADTLFTTDDLIAKNADLVRRFQRATLKGWTYAVENPTTIGAIVVKYNPTADPALENVKMIASIPLVNTGEDFIGWMKPEIWTGMEKTLREQNVLTKPVDVAQVYTLQFLKELYGK